jgi:hypothetical protein
MPSALPKHGHSYSSKSDDGGHIHCPHKSDTIFATFSAPISVLKNSCVPPYVIVPDKELEFLTDSHVKLDILVDVQESFKDSHHKVALDYDEDTVSLVE